MIDNEPVVPPDLDAIQAQHNQAASAKRYAHPQDMKIGAPRPSVIRLSRRVLIGGSASACGLLILALCFALLPTAKVERPTPASTGANILPAGIAKLPKDYSAPAMIPKLGRPRDLTELLFGAPAHPASGSPPASAPQPTLPAQDQAVASRLFVPIILDPSQPAAAASPAASSKSIPSGALQSSDQDQKLSFLNGASDQTTASLERLKSAPSPYIIEAGTVIAAALITGLRSDLPGEITAQVTENIYDSITGKLLLIPQGSRLVGQYDAHIAFGQSRALLVWTRLILPNGKSMVLEHEPATDEAGYAGLEDQTDQHWLTLFKAATLSSLLSVGAQAGTSNSENNLAQAIREGASQSFNQVGQQVVGRSLTVQPTITIRPGFPVRVLVRQDLILEPYRS